jgi:hypothetical protein
MGLCRTSSALSALLAGKTLSKRQPGHQIWPTRKVCGTELRNKYSRDTYSFEPDSLTNVGEVSIDGGPMKEQIRTRATPQRNSK